MQTTLRKETQPACLWQQAGVVSKKPCFKDFICSACQFNKAMIRVCRENEQRRAEGDKPAGKKSDRFIFWRERLKKMPLSQRPCIHHMKGHIQFRNCPKAYHCVDCEFDQFFYDQFKVNTLLKPVRFDDIDGVSLPAGFYLHPGHTWVKIEGNGMVRIGIDDFAARLLGEFDAVNAPVLGKQLTQGKTGFTFMRGNRKADFVSPVSGVITEVNSQVKKSPAEASRAPYTEGWIFMAYCPELKKDLKHLMFMDSSREFMQENVTRLYDFIEERTQLKAADGGSLVPDIYGNLTGVSWEELVEAFISPKA